MWKRQAAERESSNRHRMMPTIGDIENALRHNMFPPQQQAMQIPMPNTSVPQFFRNASYNQNYPNAGRDSMNQGGFIPFSFDSNVSMPPAPTQEQLQQHTSEIMRNAMLRKQYRNELNFPK